MKLVLKGDNSKSKAFFRSLPQSLIIGFLGIIFIIIGFTVFEKYDPNYPSLSRYLKSDTEKIMEFALPFSGFISISLAIAFPLKAIVDAKKYMINVYDDRVKGTFRQKEGLNKFSFIPFELSYQQIESVSSQKTFVYLQITGRTIQCKAFNADKVCNAIMKRIPLHM